jgi:hypothetical protein
VQTVATCATQVESHISVVKMMESDPFVNVMKHRHRVKETPEVMCLLRRVIHSQMALIIA